MIVSIHCSDSDFAYLRLVVSKTYDFTTPGEGSYSFVPKNVFYVVDSNTKKINIIQADEVQTIPVHLSGKLVVARTETSLHKRDIGFQGCSADEQTQITAAAQVAVDYAYESQKCVIVASIQDPILTSSF